LVEKEQPKIEAIYEQIFNHKAFTGRSGTFFRLRRSWFYLLAYGIKAKTCCL
jgi:hypothetical protein